MEKINHQVAVSVLMAVYNTDINLLKRSIQSVLNQSFQDFELIIVDDGSRADLQATLLAYLAQISHPITYLQHPNRGQSQSINRAVLVSKGKYIAIIDADDEYKPDHLRLNIEALKDFDLIASEAETVVEKEEDYFVPDKNHPHIMVHVDDCILFATLFGKKEVFENIQFETKYAADAHFFEEASKKYKVAKLNLRSYIYYRNNPNSISAVLKNKAQHKV
ncbi:MAG: glycosyltransferase family 2 protein [Sphingobacteriaceae bacterium]|nr:glycosyltransferase family 2 protein [Sphingobacteriaceae bacterium]